MKLNEYVTNILNICLKEFILNKLSVFSSHFPLQAPCESGYSRDLLYLIHSSDHGDKNDRNFGYISLTQDKATCV